MPDGVTTFKVVVNHEEQHSIWPADRETPAGWRETGVTGTKDECLAYIRDAWPDITPLSVRTALAAGSDPVQA